MSHTPGPWTCHSGMVWKTVENQWPKGSEVGIPIARMDREPNNGTLPVERDENARLIAAAPELLAALEAAHQYVIAWRFEYVDKPQNEHNAAQQDRIDKAIRQIDAAIAKAKP